MSTTAVCERVLMMMMMMCSSASLPPCQPRSGTHRALRGQSPATVHQSTLQQQQPLWTFIGPDSQTTLPAWQSAAATLGQNTAAANLLWRPPPHVDQAAATAVSCWLFKVKFVHTRILAFQQQGLCFAFIHVDD